MHLSAQKPDLIILNSETQALINGHGKRKLEKGERKKTSKCDSDFVGVGDWGVGGGGSCSGSFTALWPISLSNSFSDSLAHMLETQICSSCFLMTQAPLRTHSPAISRWLRGAVITVDQVLLSFTVEWWRIWYGKRESRRARGWWRRGARGPIKSGPDLPTATGSSASS